MFLDRIDSIYWTLVTDVVLISAGLIFVLRLYIVELRLQRGLPRYYRFGSAADAVEAALAPGIEERWFLADEAVQDDHHSRDYKRLRRLGKVVQWLTVISVALAIFLAAGLVSAATSIGELSITAVVLSRCMIAYVNTPMHAISSCTDNTTATYTVTPAQTDSTANATVARSSSANVASMTDTIPHVQTAAATVNVGDVTVVTLTYQQLVS